MCNVNILLSIGQSSDSHFICRFYSSLAPLTAKPYQISRNISKNLQMWRKQALWDCTLLLVSGKSEALFHHYQKWELSLQWSMQHRELFWEKLDSWFSHHHHCLTGYLNSYLLPACPHLQNKTSANYREGGCTRPTLLPQPLIPPPPLAFILPKRWSRVLRIKAIWDGLSSVPQQSPVGRKSPSRCLNYTMSVSWHSWVFVIVCLGLVFFVTS